MSISDAETLGARLEGIREETGQYAGHAAGPTHGRRTYVPPKQGAAKKIGGTPWFFSYFDAPSG